MANLFWKHNEKTLNLLSKEFETEEEFENIIMKNSDLLEDIFIITNQIRGGKKKGIPDIIGIDKDHKVCIIEMKNVKVSSDIISQVLQYAIWAQENPAEIKNLWYESEQLEEYTIDFENYVVRILIIAPAFDPSTIIATKEINFDVELIEIQRWKKGKNEFFLVNHVEPLENKKVSPVRGKGVYDEAEYAKRHNKASVKLFMSLAHELEKISKTKGWPLVMKYNRGYCALKYGNYLTCGIDWYGSKSFGLFVKLPKRIARKYQPRGSQIDDFRKKTVWYDLNKKKIPLKKFIPLFQKSFDNIVEQRG